MANWKNDPYVKEWLSKVSERTKKNYTENFPRWLAFIQMSPTEQIQKRFKDLQSSNPKERGFFEDKVIEYKNALVVQGLKPNTIASYRIPIQSFFSAHRVALKFRRGELKVEEIPEDKVVKEWIPDNQQMKQIYQHGDARDRALLLSLYQSGFSETDVSALNVEDLPNITETEGHYPITMHREKTGVLQRTCISEECVHDIKAMLEEREAKGQLEPDKDGKTPLFISQKAERLTTRFINDAIKAMVEKTYGKEDAAKFKTKSLRDAYNDALLRANLTQELKDTLFGHMRKGAKEKYAVSQQTIIDSYNRAFQYMTVNHGTQARKDIEVMRGEMVKMSQLVVKMSEETVKLREENKALTQKLEQYESKNDQRLSGIENKQTGIENVQKLIAKELGIEDRLQNITKVVKHEHK
jgi:site-specific recombinase XerD